MRNVLASKITIPSLDSDVIPREKLQSKLAKIPQYKLTLMTAGAGYGKTTTLVQYLSDQALPVGWYSLGPEDDNLYIFTIYLAAALDSLLPGLKEWYIDELKNEENLEWKPLFFSLMLGIESFNKDNIEGILVVDDWQYVHDDSDIRLFFDRFLESLPKNIHVVILSRIYVSLPKVERMDIQGKVLTFLPMDFLFTSEEIEAFFDLVDLSFIKAQDIENVWEHTDGWIMVIKLLANRWREDPDAHAAYLCGRSIEMNLFFEYLSQDILAGLCPEKQRFLMLTSLVDTFDLAYCQEIVGRDNITELLQQIIRDGLFISRIGKNVYRYHSLFREFLRQQAENYLAGDLSLYKKIGMYYWQRSNSELALYYLIKGEEWQMAANILANVGRYWASSGRQKLFNQFLKELPTEYQISPAIYLALGDIERFSSSYDKAVFWYKKAVKKCQETNNQNCLSQGYRGLGEVYIDIIQPKQAQEYLRKAYKLLHSGQEREKGALLYLMSENMINHGDSRKAQRYLRLWEIIMPYKVSDRNNLEARILLRTGRIDQAIKVLENKFDTEELMHYPCSFRESSLVLSLCYCYKGNAEKAIQYAHKGIALAHKVQAPFIEAIGWVRMGHALLLDYRHTHELCHQAYDRALELAEQIGVGRGKTEIFQGQCLMYALDGDWAEAEQIGRRAIRITKAGDDDWFTAMLYHTLGMAATICDCPTKGEKYTQKALGLFEKCHDYLGMSACYGELSYQYYKLKQKNKFKNVYLTFLKYCKKYQCEFLLDQRTLLGDLEGVVYDQLSDYHNEITANKAVTVKAAKEPELYIKTLGGLQIYRQGVAISPKAWHRKAAKQMFVLLVTMKSAPVSKEKLMFNLWPDADGQIANRNFKVALNELTNILEPERKPRAQSRYITKHDSALRIICDPTVWIDSQAFESYVETGMNLLKKQPERAKQSLISGLQLYAGEYMSGEYLDDDSLRERDRLRILASKGAEKLSECYIGERKYEEAVRWADKILQIDNCWERAYQLKLIGHGEQRDKVSLERVYRQCLTTLKNELGVEPSAATEDIYLEYKKK